VYIIRRNAINKNINNEQIYSTNPSTWPVVSSFNTTSSSSDVVKYDDLLEVVADEDCTSSLSDML